MKAILNKSSSEVDLYRRLLDDTPALLCTFLPDGTLTFVNRAYCEYFDITADELVGRSFLDFLPDEATRESARKHYLSLTPRQPSVSYEHKVVGPDGTERWQRWTDRAFFDGDGKHAYFQAVGEDITERKRAEETVQNQQRLLRIASRMGDMGGWEWVLEKNRLDWSDEVCAIHDVPPGTSPRLEEALSFYTPEWRGRAQTIFNRCAREGIPFDEELRICTAKGATVWVRVIGQAIRSEAGVVERVQGTLQNVVRKKEAEEQVRRMAVRLKTALEGITDAFFILDHEWRFTYINREAERYMERPRATLLGKVIWEEFGDLVGGVFDLEYHRAVAENRTVCFETFCDSLDVWFGIRAYPTEEGLAVYFQDITERKRVHEALRESEERYRRLVEGVQDVVFRISRSGALNSLNSAFERITGMGRDAWIGRAFLELVHPEDRDRAENLFQRVLKGESSSGSDLRVLGAQEKEIPLELTITAERVDGTIVGVMGIARDIRERRQLEERIRQMQKLDSIGQLAGGISHDFNNILMVMQGYLAILANEQGISAEGKRSFHELDRTIERACALTRQLLMFSRKQTMHLGALQFDEAVENFAKMFRRILGEDIQVEIGCRSGNTVIRGDLGMVEQVLMNLVVNARDAMPEGGRLTVATERVEVGPDRERYNPEARRGSFVRLTVTDTGQGMSDEVLKHMYEPFFTTKKAGEGVGLGLPTVYGIVKQHQGWIEVETRKDKGTRFRIYFPVSEEEVVPDGVEMSRRSSLAGRGESILLVEDDPAVRTMLGETLQAFGYQVFVAESGASALEAWEKSIDKIDLLITDVVMPGGLTGLQLTGKLLEAKPDLKALIISGYTSDETIEQWAETLNIPFLQKPCTPRRVAQVVKDCFAG